MDKQKNGLTLIEISRKCTHKKYSKNVNNPRTGVLKYKTSGIEHFLKGDSVQKISQKHLNFI